MKTLEDIWMIRSGTYQEFYKKREDALIRLSSPSLLDTMPDGTVLEFIHGYKVVDFKLPKKGKKEPKPKRPKLLT